MGVSASWFPRVIVWKMGDNVPVPSIHSILNDLQKNYKKMNKKILFILLRLTLIPFLIRHFLQRSKITIIMYHNISPITANNHFKILKAIYNIISLNEYIESTRSTSKNYLPKKSLIITFDDGYKENYHLNKLIQKYDITPTFFLCSGIMNTQRHFWWTHVEDDNTRESMKYYSDEKRLEELERLGFNEKDEFPKRQALSKAEIISMKDFADFQAHTVFHPILPKCSDSRAQDEIMTSKQELEAEYGAEIYALAYPNGNYSEREVLIAKETGYKCALGLGPGFNSPDSDLFKFMRICIPDDAGISELVVRVSGFWDFLKRLGKYLHFKF